MFINLFKIFIFSNRNKNYSPLRNYQFFFFGLQRGISFEDISWGIYKVCVCERPCVYLHMHRDVCTYQSVYRYVCGCMCICVCINMEGIGSSGVNVWCLPQPFSTYQSGVQWSQEPPFGFCLQMLGLQMCIAIPGVCMYPGTYRTSACTSTLPSSQS